MAFIHLLLTTDAGVRPSAGAIEALFRYSKRNGRRRAMARRRQWRPHSALSRAISASGSPETATCFSRLFAPGDERARARPARRASPASSAHSASLARPSSGALRTRAEQHARSVGELRDAVDRVAPALRRQPAGDDDAVERRAPGLAVARRHRLVLVVHRMQVAHHRLGALVEHMGVDLRGRNVGVAEQVLDDAQIRAVLQEVAREGVAQHVRAHARGAIPAAAATRLRSRANACRVIWPLALAAGKSHGHAAAPGAASIEQRAIDAHRGAGGVGERREALLVALAAHGDQRRPWPRRRLLAGSSASDTRRPEA